MSNFNGELSQRGEPSRNGEPSRVSGRVTKEPTGRFAYDGLERVIHEKARLGIVTSLATHPEGLLFNDLKELCSLTDGNLSRHLQILHEAGLVEVWKGYQGSRPQTLIQLTAKAANAFWNTSPSWKTWSPTLCKCRGPLPMQQKKPT